MSQAKHCNCSTSTSAAEKQIVIITVPPYRAFAQECM
jgi:hypothetical protein